MRQHDALGNARRPRRVDDREHRFGRHRLGVRVQLARVRDPPLSARRPQLRQRLHEPRGRRGTSRHRRRRQADRRIPRQLDQVRDREQLVAQADQLVALHRVLDEDDLRARVAHDELALLGGVRGVNRYRDPAREHDRDVAQHPLEPRLRHDADAIAGNHAARDQAGGDLARARVRLAEGHPLPGVLVEVPESDGLRAGGHPPLPQLDRRARIVLAQVGNGLRHRCRPGDRRFKGAVIGPPTA